MLLYSSDRWPAIFVASLAGWLVGDFLAVWCRVRAPFSRFAFRVLSSSVLTSSLSAAGVDRLGLWISSFLPSFVNCSGCSALLLSPLPHFPFRQSLLSAFLSAVLSSCLSPPLPFAAVVVRRFSLGCGCSSPLVFTLVPTSASAVAVHLASCPSFTGRFSFSCGFLLFLLVLSCRFFFLCGFLLSLPSLSAVVLLSCFSLSCRFSLSPAVGQPLLFSFLS